MIQCRPELNALTNPQSYTIRYMPQGVIGYDELAEEMARDNPVWDKEQVKAMLIARDKTIMRQLLNGKQVTLENAFSYHLSFSARLDSPDDPLPPIDKMLKVKVSASRTFVKQVRKEAHIERLPVDEKAPVILAAEDTVLGLKDVLHSSGALRLTGSGLLFDRAKAGEGCMIEGTQSGSQAQTRFVQVSNTEVTLLPDIPEQDEPWQNEYTVSVSTRYTENGSLRTGTCRRMLRTPLLIQGLSFESGPGILTDNAAAPYVRIQEGEATASLMVRIEATVDLHTDELFLRLLDMTERGQAGERVKITENTTYTLPGFSGSPLSSLTVAFDNAAQLRTMVRTHYAGQMVDVLDIRVGS
jgi:hypothetical protein